jgi:prepilin-type N-terminal cleavage/methylation domain-containing protein
MKHTTESIKRDRRAGFTLIELLVGSVVLLIVVLGTLFLHMRSNQISVDQQQFASLQHDVRSSMYFISRDLRSAGVGLPLEYSGYFLEGVDNEDQGGVVQPDRLKIMGNIEDPLRVTIENYQGSAANAALVDYSFENYHYDDDYYDNRYVMVLPNPDSGCTAGEVRIITSVTHSATGTNERFNFSPGLAPGVDPPGGFSGTCPDSDDYDGGTIVFIEVKEFWLDVDGSYPGLTAGVEGYIGNGEGGILYMTQNGYHYALAQNVENLQFEFNGDFNNDGLLDGWLPWDPAWTGDPIMVRRIQQIRIWVLGRTADPYRHVSSSVPTDLHTFRRPVVANTPAATDNDMHRRYLVQTSVSVRNLTIELYNTGLR